MKEFEKLLISMIAESALICIMGLILFLCWSNVLVTKFSVPELTYCDCASISAVIRLFRNILVSR